MKKKWKQLETENLENLEKLMEEMAGQPYEDHCIRRPGEMNSYEKHNRELERDRIYAEEVLKQFIPKNSDGSPVKYEKIL